MALKTLFEGFKQETKEMQFGDAVVEQTIAGEVRDVYVEALETKDSTKNDDTTEEDVDGPTVDEDAAAVEAVLFAGSSPLDLSMEGGNVCTKCGQSPCICDDDADDDEDEDDALNAAIDNLPDTEPEEVGEMFASTESVDSGDERAITESLAMADSLIPDTVIE